MNGSARLTGQTGTNLKVRLTGSSRERPVPKSPKLFLNILQFVPSKLSLETL